MHHALPRLIDPGRLSNFADEFRYVYRKGNIHKAPGSLVWLLLAACGGGGGGGGGPTTSGTESSGTPKMVELSGFAYNRPLEGGVVWLDVNRNQQIDAGDYRVPGEVNSKGEYRGQVPENVAKSPVMVDTTNTEYSSKLPDTLLAPEGSKVVSPITHGLVTGDIRRDQLNKDFDYLSQNPYEQTTDPAQQAINKLIIATLPKITSAIASNTRRIELLESALANLSPKTVTAKPEGAPAKPEIPAPSPVDPPPPENQKPSDITLGQSQVTLDEGQLPQGALTRITITDDGFGSVGLAPLPANSIFEYRPVAGSRGVYDLFLKAGVVLDQARVGDHRLTIQVTGDGAGNTPLPQASFTLRVRDIEHDPVLTVTAPAQQRRIDEDHYTADLIDTGIRVDASDADGDLRPLEIESRQHDGSWQADHRFVVSGGTLYMRPFQTFDYESRNNENSVIQLRITARDTDGNVIRETTSVMLSNVNETFPGILSVTGLNANNAVQTGNRVTADTDSITDPDGQPSFEYEWFRDGAEIAGEEDSSLTPVQAGTYKLVVTATDPEFSTRTSYEYEFTVTASQSGQPQTVSPAPQVNKAPTGFDMTETPFIWEAGAPRPGIIATITVLDDNFGTRDVVLSHPDRYGAFFEIQPVRGAPKQFHLVLKGDADVSDLPPVTRVNFTVSGDGQNADTHHGFLTFVTPDAGTFNRLPTGLTLSAADAYWDGIATRPTVLSIITVEDPDQLGKNIVELVSAGDREFFEIVANGTCNRFELRLKAGVRADQLPRSSEIELRGHDQLDSSLSLWETFNFYYTPAVANLPPHDIRLSIKRFHWNGATEEKPGALATITVLDDGRGDPLQVNVAGGNYRQYFEIVPVEGTRDQFQLRLKSSATSSDVRGIKHLFIIASEQGSSETVSDTFLFTHTPAPGRQPSPQPIADTTPDISAASLNVTPDFLRLEDFRLGFYEPKTYEHVTKTGKDMVAAVSNLPAGVEVTYEWKIYRHASRSFETVDSDANFVPASSALHQLIATLNHNGAVLGTLSQEFEVFVNEPPRLRGVITNLRQLDGIPEGVQSRPTRITDFTVIDSDNPDGDTAFVVYRKTPTGDYVVDDRFTVRPINDTPQTDDYRLRTRKDSVFDFEDMSNYESESGAKKGIMHLRIEATDTDGGVRQQGLVFKIFREPETGSARGISGLTEVVETDDSGESTRTWSATTSTALSLNTTLVQEGVTFRYDIYFVKESDYEVGMDLGLAASFGGRVTKVTDINSFTINEAGTYLIFVDTWRTWAVGEWNFEEQYGRRQGTKFSITDPPLVDTSSGSTGLIGQGPPEIDQDFLPGKPLFDDDDLGAMPDIL